MKVEGYGGDKYNTGRRLKEPAEWPSLRVELWSHGPGRQEDRTPEFTEISVMLSGPAAVVGRTGDGARQLTHARPGTTWICPAGIRATEIDVKAPLAECLHVFVPPALIGRSALEDYDIDPAKARLAYAENETDAVASHIGAVFRAILDRGVQPTDRLLADGMRTALLAHVLATYSRDTWRAPAKAPSMDPKRLGRVLDFIEARLASDISLDDLAAEACLSPFHFSRQFRATMGVGPHSYVTGRRVQAARNKLALKSSTLLEIALDTGFGSQANFNRVFRKVTGLTPGEYRRLRIHQVWR